MAVGAVEYGVPDISPRWGPAHYPLTHSVFPVTGLEPTPDLGHAENSQVNLAISGPVFPTTASSPWEVGKANTVAASGSG